MTKKAYVHITKQEYSPKDSSRNQVQYNTWSRDPKVDKNTPYGGKRSLKFVGAGYYEDTLPRCTGFGLRLHSLTVAARDIEEAKRHKGKVAASVEGYDPYCWQVDLGIFPLELFT